MANIAAEAAGEQPQAPPSWTEESFFEAHKSQLKSQGIPENLWSILFDKLSKETFDAGTSFTFAHDPYEVPHKRYSVLATADQKAAGNIWLIEHIWLFKSPAHALEILKKYEDVLNRMTMLTDSDTSDGQNDSVEVRAERMIEELQRYAYPVVDSTGGRMHYVMDELGSRIKFALDDDQIANVKFATLINQMSGEMLTVTWCIKDIAANEMVLRSPQHRMSLVGLKKRAWEVRFEYEQQYDWYCEYNEGSPLRNLILQVAKKKTGKTLIVGTGSSTMPIKMHEDGFTDIVATDYVTAIVEKMKTKYPSEKYQDSIQWRELDATKITSMHEDINAGMFEYVMDKGCLDALLVRDGVDGSGEGHESWMTEEPDDVRSMLDEINAALTETGMYLLTSFGSPAYLVNTVNFERAGLYLQQCFQIERDAEQLKKDARVPGAAALTSGHEFYFFAFSKVKPAED